jgi:hypothetical protein
MLLVPPLHEQQPVRLSEFGVPGADLAGIHYLRNIADADALLEAIAATKAAGKSKACSAPMHTFVHLICVFQHCWLLLI